MSITIFDQARAEVSGAVIAPDPFIVDLFEIAATLERQALFQPLPGLKRDIDDLRELGARLIKEDEVRRERFALESLEFDQIISDISKAGAA